MLVIIVPDDLASFEADLDPIVLAEVLASLEHTQVELRMPSFGMETKVELVPVLEALGIHDAFDPADADLTGIHPTADLFVSDVIHQANVDVDERGTEAAAATAVVIGRSSAPMVEVRLTVDRPFLFVLRDVPTGAALFLGRVTEPQPAQSTDPAGG